MPEDRIQTLLRRYFAKSRQDGSQRSWRCPDELKLAAFVDETLPEWQKRKIQRHLRNCACCLQQVAFLLRTEELPNDLRAPVELTRQAGQAVEERKPGRWFLAYGAPVSAAAVLVLLAAIVFVPWSTPPSSGVPTEEVRGSEQQDFSLLTPVGGLELRTFPVEFRWEPVEACLSYEIRVATLNGDLVWQDQTTSTAIQLSRHPEFENGREYYAYVRALMPGGKVIRSGVVRFRVGTEGDPR